MLTSVIRTRKCSVIAFLLALTFAGCGSVETQSFQVSQNSNVEAAQIATDADFTSYDRLHAVDMGIFFPQGADTSPDDVQRIRDIFRTAFLGQLDDYVIVTEPGPGAMTVQATLIDFRDAEYQDMMSVRSELRDMAAPGKILFLMEMRDSETERILARAADSAKTPSIADEEGEVTDWAAVEEAAAHWAVLFRRFLDQNFQK
jgi:hypothetical protein